MNYFLIYFFILVIFIKQIQGFSEAFYECIDPDRKINSPSDCTSVQIPEEEGFKCCSTKITDENKSTYNCFTLENKYATNQEEFKEYISNRSLAFLFTDTEGQMEIECPNNIKVTENYEKFSDEYLNCYNSYMKGVENENDCTKNNIPSEEGSKCCFLESSQLKNDGKIINDKRCYIIQDEYFTKEKNFGDYLLHESNIKSLDEIINTNITIKCKNYDRFFFQGKSKNIQLLYPPKETYVTYVNSSIETSTSTDVSSNDNNLIEELPIKKIKIEKSGVKYWVIILIIFGSIILIGIIVLISVFYCRKRKANFEENKNAVMTGDSSVKNI